MYVRGVDIYKICKPAECSFMKKLTPLQLLKYLANFVKVNILRTSLECLHMIFVTFFYQLQYYNINNQRLEFNFSNESYNKEQEIGSIRNIMA